MEKNNVAINFTNLKKYHNIPPFNPPEKYPEYQYNSIDKNNRIYTNTGEFFDPDKSCVMVSAKHSEIDIQRQNLKSDFQNINRVTKRIEWSQIAKYAFMIMAIMCLTLIGILSLQEWGDAQVHKAEEAKAFASAMENLGSAMVSIGATVNTQKLEILPMMQDIYKTKNILPIINREIYNNETS